MDQNSAVNATTDESIDQSIERVLQLMNIYEALALEIGTDTAKFREENKSLVENLAAVIAENNRLNTQVKEDPLGVFRNDYVKTTEEVIHALRSQIYHLSKEKEMYESLWKRTAATLEQEVPLTSLTQLKNEHSLEVQKLKSELIQVTNECDQQTRIKEKLLGHIQTIFPKLESFQRENFQLKAELKNAEEERKELEKCLVDSNELNKQQMEKATESFQKLQESIKVADEAMAEIEHLMTEKRHMEEECHHLAQTIGSVMESASMKVEKNIQDLKDEHCRELESLKNEIDRLKQAAELEKAKTDAALHRNNLLEEKLKTSNREKAFLDKDIKSAIDSISTTEAQINNLKKAIEGEKSVNQTLNMENEKLNEVVKNNQNSREKFKVLFMQLTTKMEEKICRLVADNAELRARLNL